MPQRQPQPVLPRLEPPQSTSCRHPAPSFPACAGSSQATRCEPAGEGPQHAAQSPEAAAARGSAPWRCELASRPRCSSAPSAPLQQHRMGSSTKRVSKAGETLDRRGGMQRATSAGGLGRKQGITTLLGRSSKPQYNSPNKPCTHLQAHPQSPWLCPGALVRRSSSSRRATRACRCETPTRGSPKTTAMRLPRVYCAASCRWCLCAAISFTNRRAHTAGRKGREGSGRDKFDAGGRKGAQMGIHLETAGVVQQLESPYTATLQQQA